MKIQQSPVNDKFSAKLIDEINVVQVAKDYKTYLGIDISRFVKAQSLQRYQCEFTGLEFYRGIMPGDGKFYEELMDFDWYYNSWKWEHEKVKGYLKPNDKLIEIGSGSGGFLNGIKDLYIEGQGLEINENAVNMAMSKNLNVINESLDTFSVKNEGTFDWSVSFQVLEHIDDVQSFLSNSVKLLKSGGKLVISVPNNDSFIGSAYNILNLPPHHMNLWAKESLTKIAPLFGLKLNHFEFEPLQKYHFNWYVSSILESEKETFAKKPPILRGMAYRSTKATLERWVEKEAQNILGHSILAIYTKI